VELQRYNLCPNCSECPEVVITPEAVTIGEAGNEVRLGPAEWDVLVRAIRSGELRALSGAGEEFACACGCGCD
jgi:hypothetical protein